MVDPAAIRGMNPEQIRRHLGLKDRPTHVSDVFVPRGTQMSYGRVGAQPKFGIHSPGGMQYVLNDSNDASRVRFTNTRPLHEF